MQPEKEIPADTSRGKKAACSQLRYAGIKKHLKYIFIELLNTSQRKDMNYNFIYQKSGIYKN